MTAHAIIFVVVVVALWCHLGITMVAQAASSITLKSDEGALKFGKESDTTLSRSGPGTLSVTKLNVTEALHVNGRNSDESLRAAEATIAALTAAVTALTARVTALEAAPSAASFAAISLSTGFTDIGVQTINTPWALNALGYKYGTRATAHATTGRVTLGSGSHYFCSCAASAFFSQLTGNPYSRFALHIDGVIPAAGAYFGGTAAIGSDNNLIGPDVDTSDFVVDATASDKVVDCRWTIDQFMTQVWSAHLSCHSVGLTG